MSDTTTEVRDSSHRPDEKDYVQIIEVDHQHAMLDVMGLMEHGGWGKICSIAINDPLIHRDFRVPLLLKFAYTHLVQSGIPQDVGDV